MFFSKKIIATVISTLLATYILPVFSVNAADNESVNVANEEDIQNIKQDEDSITLDLQGVSSEEESYMYKIASIGEYYYFDDSDNLALDLSKDELVEFFDFTETEAEKVFDQILITNGEENIITPYFHMSNGKLYISNLDLESGVFSAILIAAQSGPAAVSAAFTALSTSLGGPAGVFIGTLVSLVGGPGLYDIAMHGVQALVDGRGIYIGVQTSYPFLDVGYWAG